MRPLEKTIEKARKLCRAVGAEDDFEVAVIIRPKTGALPPECDVTNAM